MILLPRSSAVLLLVVAVLLPWRRRRAGQTLRLPVRAASAAAAQPVPIFRVPALYYVPLAQQRRRYLEAGAEQIARTVRRDGRVRAEDLLDALELGQRREGVRFGGGRARVRLGPRLVLRVLEQHRFGDLAQRLVRVGRRLRDDRLGQFARDQRTLVHVVAGLVAGRCVGREDDHVFGEGPSVVQRIVPVAVGVEAVLPAENLLGRGRWCGRRRRRRRRLLHVGHVDRVPLLAVGNTTV